MFAIRNVGLSTIVHT